MRYTWVLKHEIRQSRHGFGRMNKEARSVGTYSAHLKGTPPQAGRTSNYRSIHCFFCQGVSSDENESWVTCRGVGLGNGFMGRLVFDMADFSHGSMGAFAYAVVCLHMTKMFIIINIFLHSRHSNVLAMLWLHYLLHITLHE